MSYHKKTLGMLWGLHAGDSLGAPLEFLPPSLEWNSLRELTGGGAFNWFPGEATDDTDLMLCVLHSIKNYREFSFDQLKIEMLQWFDSRPPDIGTTTIKGLRNLKSGFDLKKCGPVNNYFQGNGSIMRVAPLALLDDVAVGMYQTERVMGLRDIIETQAKMTHGHHLCFESDLILVPVLKALLNGASKEEAFQVAQRVAAQTNPIIFERIKKIPKLKWHEVATSGFCVDTLCAGLWAFVMHQTFEDSVVSIVNRGDDSDSCGAVAGALCGAFYGSDAIPSRWLNKLEFKKEIQDSLAAFFGQ